MRMMLPGSGGARIAHGECAYASRTQRRAGHCRAPISPCRRWHSVLRADHEHRRFSAGRGGGRYRSRFLGAAQASETQGEDGESGA